MRHYLFADEAGCTTFARKPNISRYFILCTVHSDSCDIGHDLLSLRRRLIWEGHEIDDAFHAHKDKQAVRDEVFQLLSRHNFRVDATILEKSKADPQTRITEERFYQYAWYYHFKYVGPRIISTGDELQISAAAIGDKKKRAAFRATIHDVAYQVLPQTTWKASFWPAASDPCLQAVDYCAWALQRKWERGDTRSYDIISSKVASEFDLWSRGTTHYY